jgi:hypothetical protein
MKKAKLIIGLTLSLGLLFSISIIKKGSVANAGWALSKLFDSGEASTLVVETGLSVVGAYEGAEIGAQIGWLGGPGGAVVGAVVGAL